MNLTFTANVMPEPQGSIKAFVLPAPAAISTAIRKIRNGGDAYKAIQEACRHSRAILTSDNDHLKAYRAQIASAAKKALWEASLDTPAAEEHVPVAVTLVFYVERPKSAKRREYPSVRPDLDKLCRSTIDALAGLVYVDDGQVVDVVAKKRYGTPERVEVHCTVLKPEGVLF